MSVKSKRLAFATICLVVWFVIADAYWMAKDRVVSKCRLENGTELLKNGRVEKISDANWIFYEECSWAEGAGNYWESPRGMAYWEILLMGPVIYRFRFDL